MPGKKPKSPFGRFLENLSHLMVYGVFRAVEGVLYILPISLVSRLGRGLGAFAYIVSGKYRRLALHNVRLALGDRFDETRRRQIVREHFRSLFGNALCGLKLPMMSPEEVLRRVSMEGIEHTREAMAAGTPILYLVCHISCWELLTQVPSLFTFGRRPATVYQPLRNPYLNGMVLRRRRKLNYILFDRQDGFVGPMKHMREGGCLGVLVDQHAGDHGIWTPFFGRLASTTPIAAMLAQRSHGVMMPMTIYDDGPGRWRMVNGPAVAAPEGRPTLETMTMAMNRAVEQVILHKPENWFWVHNRWKTPKPAFLLRHYKRGVVLPVGSDPSSLKPFELLVRSPNWLGDACMAFPAVRAMKAGRPDLKLTVFGPEKLRELWESQPEVDRYIGKEGKEGLFSVARRIKATQVPFDAAILLTNSTRSTLEFWLAGIPRLVGFKGSLRSKFLTQIIKEPPKMPGPPMHHALRYLHIARSCGAETEHEEKILKGELPPDVGSREGRQSIRIGICAGAEYGPAKRWPLERYATVARQVSATLPEVEWVFFGAPGEAAMGEQLSGMLEGVRHTNLVGKTRLSELITHLRGCRMLLTNDTGTMHLAAALGTPTVSIFGSTDPILTGPLGNQHTVIQHLVPCSPCFERECPFGHYDCMQKITPEEVATAVIARYHASA